MSLVNNLLNEKGLAILFAELLRNYIVLLKDINIINLIYIRKRDNKNN